MQVLERQRSETQQGTTVVEAGHRSLVPILLATLAVAAVIAGGLYLTLTRSASDSTETRGATVSDATVTPQIATPSAAPSVDMDTLMVRLANQGLIPSQAVDWERIRLERLVNQGLVPSQALLPQQPPSLYTAQELSILDAVSHGDIPVQTLDGEPFRTKRLINLGLIPAQSAE